MKYVSLDLETTGLHPETHSITEIAAVIDDLSNPRPIESLPAIIAYVGHDGDDMIWNTVALSMFSNRINEYNKAEKIHVTEVINRLIAFLCPFLIEDFAEKSKKPEFSPIDLLAKQKVTFAGKNFASFDRGFLAALPHSDVLLNMTHHRCIDPGSMYLLPSDTTVPSTEECKKRANLPGKVLHAALDDARDVVRLIRYKYNLPTT